MNNDGPPRSNKGAAVRRAGLITAGMMLVLAVGIFTAKNFLPEPIAVVPKSSAPPLIGKNTSIVLPIALDTAPPQVKHPENRATSPQEHHHAQTAAPPQVNRAAEPAAIEKKRKFELELGERRRKDTERERLERQRAELERLEREKVKVEIEQSEPTQDEAVSRKRLLGTF